MSLRQLLAAAVDQLRKAGNDDARLDAEVLLCHLLECNRAHLRAWPERELSPQQQADYRALVERRRRGEPIAYITGSREFWSLRLQVTPATLIPRPDTERLVELALERIPPDAAWQVADLGTGSGAIALAIARERPRCRVVATDASADALAVAAANGARLGLGNVVFRHGAWLAPLAGERCQLIVSNPPYIRSDDPHLAQGDLRFEPPTALSAGADGLDDIRLIAAGARHHLTPGGWLLLEHGCDQGAAVRALLQQNGYGDVLTYQDYAGLDRVSAGRSG